MFFFAKSIWFLANYFLHDNTAHTLPDKIINIELIRYKFSDN